MLSHCSYDKRLLSCLQYNNVMINMINNLDASDKHCVGEREREMGREGVLKKTFLHRDSI